MKKAKAARVIFVFLLLLSISSCSESTGPVATQNNRSFPVLFRARNMLHIINTDSTGHNVFTSGEYIVLWAGFSPDYSKAVFNDQGTRYHQIVLMDLKTRERTPITDDSLYHESPVVSPDGISVVYSTETQFSHLSAKSIVPGKTSWFAKRLNEEYARFTTYRPTFSSDGLKMSMEFSNLSDSSGILIMDANGKSSVIPMYWFHSTQLSPDGNKILFKKSLSSDEEGLYIINTDGTNQKLLSNIPYGAEASFSPDGSKILFPKFKGNYDLCVMDTDGKNLVNLTNSDEGEFQAKFTPDGSKIVFLEIDPKSDSWKLCIMNPDGSGRKVLYEDSSNYGMKLF